MEKIGFVSEDGKTEEFFVLEQTRVGGISYILVSDSTGDDGECMILKDTSLEEEKEATYEPVEDEAELTAVLKIFEELLEDVSIER